MATKTNAFNKKQTKYFKELLLYLR